MFIPIGVPFAQTQFWKDLKEQYDEAENVLTHLEINLSELMPVMNHMLGITMPADTFRELFPERVSSWFTAYKLEDNKIHFGHHLGQCKFISTSLENTMKPIKESLRAYELLDATDLEDLKKSAVLTVSLHAMHTIKSATDEASKLESDLRFLCKSIPTFKEMLCAS